jgi:hypothetical protein
MIIVTIKQIKELIPVCKKRILSKLYPGKYETKTIDL